MASDSYSHNARFSRQAVLPQITPTGQKRLQQARVAIVGCGGLGAPVAMALASAGVLTFTLFDDDSVEVSNLNRQFLFSHHDIAQRKVEAAKTELLRKFPDVTVHAFDERIVVQTVRQRIKGHDLVIDCTDGIANKYLLNDACVKESIPLVHGAATAWAGQVMVVDNTHGCLRCIYPTQPGPKAFPSCRTAGIIAPVTMTIGAIQAAEALKVLLDVSPRLVGKFLSVDLLSSSFRTIRFTKDPQCPCCSEHGRFDATRVVDYDPVTICDDDERE